MKPLFIKLIAILTAFSVFMSSCASTTIIKTNPPGAVVKINDEQVGTTPYIHRDTRISLSTINIQFNKPGYENLQTSITKDEALNVGAIIAGIFVYIPFIWALKYKPLHEYELRPIKQQSEDSTIRTNDTFLIKTEQLRELKKLLDENIINQEEYEIEKKKILNQEDN